MATDIRQPQTQPMSSPELRQPPKDSTLIQPAELIRLAATDQFDWEAIEQEGSILNADLIEMDHITHRPVFAGTRIAVDKVVDDLAAGRTASELSHVYPDLRPSHIRAALAYAGDAVREYAKALFAGHA